MVQKMLDEMVYIDLVEDEKIKFLNSVRTNMVADPAVELRVAKKQARERRGRTWPLDLSLPGPVKYEEPVPDPIIPDNDVPLDLTMRAKVQKLNNEQWRTSNNTSNKKIRKTVYRQYNTTSVGCIEKWPPRAMWPDPEFEYKWQLNPA